MPATVEAADELARAVMARDRHLVKTLLDAGHDINGDGTRMTALMAAARGGNEKMVRFLLQRGARADVANNSFFGRQAIHYASTAGKAECVRILIEEGHADPNAGDLEGNTALHAAIFRGNDLNTIRVLLAAGASANACGREGYAALGLAIVSKNVQLVRMVVEAGAYVNTICVKGQRCLSFAAEAGGLEVVQYLLKVGAEVNARDRPGNYAALHYACRSGDVGIAQALVAAGADINAVDDDGRTPLVEALTTGPHMRLMRMLLQAGANPNTLHPVHKLAPLHLAVAGRHKEVVNLLLEHGADIEGPPGSVCTPSVIALQRGCVEIGVLLLVRGASTLPLDMYQNGGDLVTWSECASCWPRPWTYTTCVTATASCRCIMRVRVDRWKWCRCCLALVPACLLWKECVESPTHQSARRCIWLYWLVTQAL